MTIHVVLFFAKMLFFLCGGTIENAMSSNGCHLTLAMDINCIYLAMFSLPVRALLF